MKTTNTPPTPVAIGDNTTTTTADRPWPGDHQWIDEDYKQFVQLYSQDAFPEIRNDPTAWDEQFISAGDPDAPHRPVSISASDYINHLPPRYHTSPGLLAVKLWEIARAKGFTKTFDQQHELAIKEQQLREAEAEKQRLRREIEALKSNLPAPIPGQPVDPRQLWHDKISQHFPPGAPLIDKVKCIQSAVMAGQPFRSAALAAPESAHEETFGPLMFPESADAIQNPCDHLEPPEIPDPPLRKWTADATTAQIINGAARDLADLVSLLASRQRVAVGYAADKESINQAVQLTRSLRDLTHVMHTTELTTQVKKRGRPRKERYVDSALLENANK